MSPLALTHATAVSCLGQGLAATLQALRDGACGLEACDFLGTRLPTWMGRVPGIDDAAPELGLFDCRNNRLARLALQQDGLSEAVDAARARYGAARIGVFLGTSTSGILETELAYRQRDADAALPPHFSYRGHHNPYSLADFVRQHLGLTGPAAVVSSACSSGAKVFASAWRLIEAGLIDAALVGGVDSLCLTTLYGFNSLELTAPEPCRPYDAGRRGISIGEGAGFVLLQRADATDEGEVLLLGAGESSDAHHMSAPHPEGRGAREAMQAALAQAGLPPEAIDYINLHGTATPSNDAAEGRAVLALFGDRVPASSTKGATGHTLGAAGAIEAVISLLALRHGLIPGSPGTRTVDPALPLDYRLQAEPRPLRHVLSNSFGFGGSNCSLVFGLREARP